MASGFSLWAQPWWVNLLILVPALSFLSWRRSGLRLSWRRLLCLLAFGIAFGFVEAAVVVYLRAGLTPSGAQAASQLAPETYQQIIASLAQFPRRLLTVELCREAATMVMLLTCRAAHRAAERRSAGPAFSGPSPPGTSPITPGCGRCWDGRHRCGISICCF